MPRMSRSGPFAPDRWKYIRRFGDRTAQVLPNCDDGPSKDLWLQHGWRGRRCQAEQLHDLIFDPCEMSNLAGDPAAAAVLADMPPDGPLDAADLGSIADRHRPRASAGAVVNDPNALSPRDRPSPAR